MYLPDVSDPRWREVVTGRKRYALQNLATQMLVTRLRLRTRKGDEAVIAEAIETAWAFFDRFHPLGTTKLKTLSELTTAPGRGDVTGFGLGA